MEFFAACDPGRPLAVCRRPPTREDSEITGHLLKQQSVNLFLQITNSHRCDMELQSVLPLLAFLLLAASLLFAPNGGTLVRRERRNRPETRARGRESSC